MMETQEKIDAIHEAQEKLVEAIEALKDIARGDGWAENYIIAPLEIVASKDHGYLDSSPNLDTWIESMADEDALSTKEEE